MLAWLLFGLQLSRTNLRPSGQCVVFVTLRHLFNCIELMCKKSHGWVVLTVLLKERSYNKRNIENKALTVNRLSRVHTIRLNLGNWGHGIKEDHASQTSQPISYSLWRLVFSTPVMLRHSFSRPTKMTLVRIQIFEEPSHDGPTTPLVSHTPAFLSMRPPRWDSARLAK